MQRIVPKFWIQKGVPIFHACDGEPKFSKVLGGTKALHIALKLPQVVRPLLYLIMFQNYLLHFENCMSAEISISGVSL